MSKTLFVGFFYGLGLAVFGVMLAAGGHGSSMLLDIASAPFSFLGFVFSVVAPPIMWSVIGWLSGGSSVYQRRLALALVLLHYLSFPLVPLLAEYPEGEYLAKMFAYNPAFVVFSFGYYLFGQVLVWLAWFRAGKFARAAGI